jgi:hypothetical protein
MAWLIDRQGLGTLPQVEVSVPLLVAQSISPDGHAAVEIMKARIAADTRLPWELAIDMSFPFFIFWVGVIGTVHSGPHYQLSKFDSVIAGGFLAAGKRPPVQQEADSF